MQISNRQCRIIQGHLENLRSTEKPTLVIPSKVYERIIDALKLATTIDMYRTSSSNVFNATSYVDVTNAITAFDDPSALQKCFTLLNAKFGGTNGVTVRIVNHSCIRLTYRFNRDILGMLVLAGVSNYHVVVEDYDFNYAITKATLTAGGEYDQSTLSLIGQLSDTLADAKSGKMQPTLCGQLESLLLHLSGVSHG